MRGDNRKGKGLGLSWSKKQPIHLVALEIEDLEVVSTIFQDAITRIADMVYQRRIRRFVMVATRFRWECVGATVDTAERIRTGLHFEGVLAVRSRNVDFKNSTGLLVLLAVEAVSIGSEVNISLIFSGGAVVELRAEYLDCRCNDMGRSWPAVSKPDHDLKGEQ